MEPGGLMFVGLGSSRFEHDDFHGSPPFRSSTHSSRTLDTDSRSIPFFSFLILYVSGSLYQLAVSLSVIYPTYNIQRNQHPPHFLHPLLVHTTTHLLQFSFLLFARHYARYIYCILHITTFTTNQRTSIGLEGARQIIWGTFAVHGEVCEHTRGMGESLPDFVKQ